MADHVFQRARARVEQGYTLNQKRRCRSIMKGRAFQGEGTSHVTDLKEDERIVLG